MCQEGIHTILAVTFCGLPQSLERNSRKTLKQTMATSSPLLASSLLSYHAFVPHNIKQSMKLLQHH
jgi:hypothetical protein